MEQGGELVAGGERPDLETGFYVAPTLIAGCKPDNAAVQQEFFGPVVVVVPFDDEDEAVAIANGTEFGLYDYVFIGRHHPGPAGGPAAPHRQRRPQHRPAQPRGARSAASRCRGVGRDGGSFGLHAYSELQSIVWPG